MICSLLLAPCSLLLAENIPVEDLRINGKTRQVLNKNVVLTPQQADAQDYLTNLTDTSARAARFTFTSGGMSGKVGVSPGPGYPALAYVRDYAMAIRARPEISTPSELLDIINAHFAAHGGSGQIYDALGLDSAAYSAVTSTPFPCYDNIFYLVDLCDSHFQKTGLTTAYTTNQTAITNALAYVPLQNHLVYIADNATLANVHNGWGFQDQVASSGYELVCSVLRYRALNSLAKMATAAGQTSNASVFSAEAATIPANLQTQLWDGTAGWFKNASIKNQQHNVMGSAFAVDQDAVTPAVKSAIVANLISGRPGGVNALAGKGFYDHGMIRHLPLNENWTSTRAGVGAAGRFQNGGYWPVAIGWVCHALAQNGHADEADKILSEYIAYCRSLDPALAPLEWANTGGGYTGTTNYLVSATHPLEIHRGKLINSFAVQYPGLTCFKVSVSLTQFQDESTETFDLLLATLPAKAVILNTTVKHSAALTGGSVSAATAQIQTANNNYGTAYNVFQSPMATRLDFYGTPKSENFTTPTDVNLHIILTGDGSENLTTGAIDAWITYMVRP